MTYLLDTHVFVWLVGEANKVPARIRDELSDPSRQLLVSSVSAFEVATKVRVGTFDHARHLISTWQDRVADIGAGEIALTTRHSELAGSLEWAHRDPFDRMLAAQALVGNLTLVTADPVFADVIGLQRLSW